MPLDEKEREALLSRLAGEWESFRPAMGFRVPAKASYMAKQLEGLGEPAMSEQESARWCGRVTVNPDGTP